jgi:hypothetical protein
MAFFSYDAARIEHELLCRPQIGVLTLIRRFIEANRRRIHDFRVRRASAAADFRP